MPRISLASLFLSCWCSHAPSCSQDPKSLVQLWTNPNHNQTAPHTILPCDGEIKTLKLATKSAFCLVPGTSGPQNSCRMQSNVRVGVAAFQPWIHLDCDVDMSNWAYCATPNAVAVYSCKKLKSSCMNDFIKNHCCMVLTVGSMFFHTRLAKVHSRTQLHLSS